MNPEKKSPDLDQLKQLLAKSYDGSKADDVPPMPEGLRDRITDQYGHSTTTPAHQVERKKVGFFSSLSQFFATPALQAVTAAVILLLVATVILTRNPSTPGGGMRGDDENLPSVTCILYGLDDTEQTAIAASGLGEDALTTATSPDALRKALEADGARIVINGQADLILAYRPGSDTPAIEEPLPADPTALTGKIAEIIEMLDQ